MLPHDLLASVSGTLVGFDLGLVGGGGSILAVPLLVYFVGVKSPHVAIGMSAVAVALSALMNLWGLARQHHVKWHACRHHCHRNASAGDANDRVAGIRTRASRLR